MEKSVKKNNSSFIWLVILIVVGWLGYKFFFGKWTLMLCEETLDNGVECSSIARTEEYSSKEACMTSGKVLLNTYPAFECGRNCKYDGNFWLCKEICNKNGFCSK